MKLPSPDVLAIGILVLLSFLSRVDALLPPPALGGNTVCRCKADNPADFVPELCPEEDPGQPLDAVGTRICKLQECKVRLEPSTGARKLRYKCDSTGDEFCFAWGTKFRTTCTEAKNATHCGCAFEQFIHVEKAPFGVTDEAWPCRPIEKIAFVPPGTNPPAGYKAAVIAPSEEIDSFFVGEEEPVEYSRANMQLGVPDVYQWALEYTTFVWYTASGVQFRDGLAHKRYKARLRMRDSRCSIKHRIQTLQIFSGYYNGSIDVISEAGGCNQPFDIEIQDLLAADGSVKFGEDYLSFLLGTNSSDAHRQGGSISAIEVYEQTDDSCSMPYTPYIN